MIRGNCINNTERVSGGNQLWKVFNQMGNFHERRAPIKRKSEVSKNKRRRRRGYKHERLTVEILDLLNYYRCCLLSEHGEEAKADDVYRLIAQILIFLRHCLFYNTEPNHRWFSAEKRKREMKNSANIYQNFSSQRACVCAARMWIQYLFTLAGSKLKRVLFVITRKN